MTTRIMTGKRVGMAMTLFVLPLMTCALTGCSPSGGGATMEKSEEANFKGGPMPPEAVAAMKKASEASRSSAGPKSAPK